MGKMFLIKGVQTCFGEDVSLFGTLSVTPAWE